MPWQGDTSNPVPSNVDKTKENPYFKNTKNKALDVRRDTDTKKNFTITLLDIDTTIIDYLDKVINLGVIDSGTSVKVPILYGNPERWKAAQVDGYFRDINGKIQLPVLMFKRGSFNKNESLQTFNRYLTYPVITKFTEKNKYDRFSLMNNSVAPVHQIHAVTLPDHIKIEYEFMVWTEYVEQMNNIIEKINFASDDYWGDPQRFKFRVSINDYTHTTEVSTDKDRMVRTNFSLSVYAYLLPESFEDRKSTVQKSLTPRQIKITSETVESSAQMNVIKKSIDKQSNSNPANPYYRIGNVMSANNETWEFPTPTIDTETSTTLSGEILSQIRQSYSALIQQDYIVNSSTGSTATIWHDAPTSPNSPGQEGWMAYDGDYHYIYVGGRWRRQAITDFE
jgi:hypothetical protein